MGRYLLQDSLGQLWKPLGETRKLGPRWLASFLIVTAWGWFLIQGVRDPLGGINSLWPLFGIANQLLAAIALCLATTIILKMQLPESGAGRPVYAWITLVPLLWLLAVTITAGVEKNLASGPGHRLSRRGWHGHESARAIQLAAGRGRDRRVSVDDFGHGHAEAAREWFLLLARRRRSNLSETAPVWLPDYAMAEARPRGLGGVFLLALMLVKELSGQAAIHRASAHVCLCGDKQDRVEAYLQATEKRFDGINRCC